MVTGRSTRLVDSVTNGLDTMVAEKAQLNGTHIYRTLSAKGNPEIRSLSAILKTMGLRLAVQPIQHPAAHA